MLQFSLSLIELEGRKIQFTLSVSKLNLLYTLAGKYSTILVSNQKDQVIDEYVVAGLACMKHETIQKQLLDVISVEEIELLHLQLRGCFPLKGIVYVHQTVRATAPVGAKLI